MKSNAAVWLAIASSICSSLAAIYQASATKLLSPLVVAAIGSILGGILVGAITLLTRHNISIRSVRDVRGDLLSFILIRGVLGGILFNVALALTTGIKAVFFTKAEPYFILLWRWILDGKRAPSKHLKLLAVHFFGAVLLSTGGEFSLEQSQLGDLLLLIAVAMLGYTYRTGTRLSVSLGALETSCIMQLVSGVMLLLPAILFLPSEIHLSNEIGWKHLLCYVLLFNVLALSFWLTALKNLEAWIVSALRAIGPLVAAPFAWFFFSEQLGIIQVLGGAMVLATSWLIAKER